MDDLEPRLLVDLLRDHIVPDKSLGQHFLLDQEVISRSIEICKEEGFSVEEKHFTLDELKQADSAFFTGTAAEVVGLESLDDYKFPLSWESSLGYKLMKLYKQEVVCERSKKLSEAV